MALALFVSIFAVCAQTETSAEVQTETEETDWETVLTDLLTEIGDLFENADDETLQPVIELNAAEQEYLAYLSNELEESADHLMRNGEDVDDIYSSLNWRSVADIFPEKFDLRDRGTVTPVKNQAPWGTCWKIGRAHV